MVPGAAGRYAFSQSTLEDVFLKFAAEQEEAEARESGAAAGASSAKLAEITVAPGVTGGKPLARSGTLTSIF